VVVGKSRKRVRRQYCVTLEVDTWDALTILAEEQSRARSRVLDDIILEELFKGFQIEEKNGGE
jgi:hypothetical protein